MIKLPFSAMLLMGALLACSASPRDQSIARDLPNERDLPHKVNEDCACVQQNQCLVLEARAGTAEVRHLTCRWLEPNKSARCEFEERWVSQSSADPWQARSIRTIALPNGRWCSEN